MATVGVKGLTLKAWWKFALSGFLPVFVRDDSCRHKDGVAAGGNDRMCVHDGQWSTEPQRRAPRYGDRTHGSRPATSDQRLRHQAHA